MQDDLSFIQQQIGVCNLQSIDWSVKKADHSLQAMPSDSFDSLRTLRIGIRLS
jgi:hypothetical protein